MEDKHEFCALHLVLKITKVVLEAATVAGIFCLVKEAHKVHRAIENNR